ncbi:MAG: hypothetical protein IIV08_03850, partial [Selenomonadales bacterium]|nr:hypothetical protein [Selenomonadales bacterium]
VGIYIESGISKSITAIKGFNIITKSAENGNSLTNAIWVDPSATQKASLTINNTNGAVNIRMEGGMGGNGIAIAKTDRWGEDSKEATVASSITIKGDVAIKGETNQDWGIGLRKDNVISRYNNTGIITKVEKGKIDIGGNVDIDVYGNGIATVADDSSITVAGGGQITVPKGTDYAYYALASYGGDVAMNLGADGNTAGTSDVNIDGDIFVLKKADVSDASVSLALTTANSHLSGIIDNGSTANLYLQNGAAWTNEANNTRYYQDNEDIGNGEKSRVTNFYGGSNKDAMGVINQTANSKDLTIDNYSGHTMVTYTHNAQTPTTILGGDTTITKAAADSSITLRTDSDGIDVTIDESVEAVLDALAHKLYYSSYVSGERNLDGYVQIAEGLTTASVAKAVGDIEFNETNGQGGLKTDGTGGNEGGSEGGNEGGSEGGNEGGSEGGGNEGTEPTPPTPTIPDSQEQDTFTTPIRGLNEEVYINAGVLKDGVYEFTMDKTTLNVDKSEIAGGPWLGNIGSAVSASGVGTKTVIDLNGNDFEVNATHSSNHSTGITAINDGIVEINNPGDITVTATGGGQTAALFANGSGEIHIHNGEGGTVIARADAASAPNGAVIKTMNGKAGESKIIIDGMVDVVADKNEGSNEAISAVASRIEIGGGNIEAKNGAWAAIRAYGEFQTQNAGIVNINVTKDADGNITGAGDRKTTIKGDFVTNGGMGSKGQISVGLKGEESFWEGKYTDNVGYGVTPGQLGSVNLWIEDGAHWTGYSSGSVNLNLSGDGSYWDGYSTSNKMLLSLKNGATWKNSNASQTSLIGNFIGDGGSIDMTGGVTIDNYSGDTTVLYRHEVTAPVMTLADDDTTNTETTPQVNIIGGDITI